MKCLRFLHTVRRCWSNSFWSVWSALQSEHLNDSRSFGCASVSSWSSFTPDSTSSTRFCLKIIFKIRFSTCVLGVVWQKFKFETYNFARRVIFSYCRCLSIRNGYNWCRFVWQRLDLLFSYKWPLKFKLTNRFISGALIVVILRNLNEILLLLLQDCFNR